MFRFGVFAIFGDAHLFCAFGIQTREVKHQAEFGAQTRWLIFGTISAALILSLRVSVANFVELPIQAHIQLHLS